MFIVIKGHFLLRITSKINYFYLFYFTFKNMNYPHCIDYTKFNNKHYKFYDVDIIERNYIYPFSFNKAIIKEAIIKENDKIIKNDINNFIQLPNFENLILDRNGLPFIPHNKFFLTNK